MHPSTQESANPLRVERVFHPSRLAPQLLATAYEIVLPIALGPTMRPVAGPSLSSISPPRPTRKRQRAAALF